MTPTPQRGSQRRPRSRSTNAIRTTPAAHKRHLFRYLGGFEGFLGIEVSPNPNRLAVTDVAHDADRRLGLGSTPPATRADLTDCDDSVTEVSDLRVLGVPVVEDLVQIAEEFANA